jgi:hypothetical protein
MFLAAKRATSTRPSRSSALSCPATLRPSGRPSPYVISAAVWPPGWRSKRSKIDARRLSSQKPRSVIMRPAALGHWVTVYSRPSPVAPDLRVLQYSPPGATALASARDIPRSAPATRRCPEARRHGPGSWALEPSGFGSHVQSAEIIVMYLEPDDSAPTAGARPTGQCWYRPRSDPCNPCLASMSGAESAFRGRHVGNVGLAYRLPMDECEPRLPR